MGVRVSERVRGAMDEGVTGDGQVLLGRLLAQERVAQGRTVEDVARAINLRATVLRGIEADSFALCGGDVYARGHIRAYARVLGMDPAPLIDAYDTTTGAEPEGPRVALLDDVDVPLERRGPNWVVIAGAALVVVVALLVVQLVGELRAPGRSSQVVADPAVTASVPATPPALGASATTPPAPPTGPASSSTLAPTAPTTLAPTTPATTPGSPVRSDQVAVALRVTGDSWVEVRNAKGRTVWSGLLSKGAARSFTDTSALRLTLGNAGGVELTVNGTSLGAAGKAGQVKRLTFRPGEVAQLS